jgi:hypothetical protein
MDNQFQERRRKGYANMRSMLDYGMGLLVLGAAFVIFFSDKIELLKNKFNGTEKLIFGGLFLLYAAWRLYRGYAKKYFDD